MVSSLEPSIPEKKIRILKMCAKSKQRVVNDERSITFSAAINTQAKNIVCSQRAFRGFIYFQNIVRFSAQRRFAFWRALILREIVQTSSLTKYSFSNVAKDQIHSMAML